MNLRNITPSLYHSILPGLLLDVEFPNETIATCETCTVCRSPQSPYTSTKCCFYHPSLPNFMLGAILTDEEERFSLGKERVRAQIKNRAGITPYGTVPTLLNFHLQKKTLNQEFSFQPPKLLESLRCPYYDRGKCTLYKYRDKTCVTFFCSSIGGVAGKKFWKKVKNYLNFTETILSQYAMHKLGWPPAKMKTWIVTSADFDFEDDKGNINEEKYSRLWGKWAGREEEFYIKCYKIINNVDVEIFKGLTGLSHEILEEAIYDTQKIFIKNKLPKKLILHDNVVEENLIEGFTYFNLGEVSSKVPSFIVPLIRSFNGKRTTVEVFQLGYNILYNMEEVVDELREKGILIE